MWRLGSAGGGAATHPASSAGAMPPGMRPPPPHTHLPPHLHSGYCASSLPWSRARMLRAAVVAATQASMAGRRHAPGPQQGFDAACRAGPAPRSCQPRLPRLTCQPRQGRRPLLLHAAGVTSAKHVWPADHLVFWVQGWAVVGACRQGATSSCRCHAAQLAGHPALPMHPLLTCRLGPTATEPSAASWSALSEAANSAVAGRKPTHLNTCTASGEQEQGAAAQE